MEKSGRSERTDRDRREPKPREAGGARDAGSGEGAASALATLRELERNRNACAPAEDVPGERRDTSSRPDGS